MTCRPPRCERSRSASGDVVQSLSKNWIILGFGEREPSVEINLFDRKFDRRIVVTVAECVERKIACLPPALHADQPGATASDNVRCSQRRPLCQQLGDSGLKCVFSIVDRGG